MKKNYKQSGFSLLELIIVMSVLAVVALMATMTLRQSELLAIDSQGKKVIDILDEARQRALNQRRTMRVEINRTRGNIRIINENSATMASDDEEIKSIPLDDEIAVGTVPNNIDVNPTTTSPIPVAVYQTSNYPLSLGEEKITLRFRRNGQVSDVGTDDVGTGSLVSGATIFVYTNTLFANGSNKPQMVRAISLLGGSGDTSYLKCVTNASNDCINWVK
jgi:prepilin-type N-terminal cleavage/methylation domain-containing protein